jgi:peroxin-11B
VAHDRKLLRVGKNIEHFKAASVAYDSKNPDPVVKYLTVGRQLGYAGYLTFDAITYLDAAGIRPSPAAKRLQREAYKSWFAGLTFSAIMGAYGLYLLREREKKASKEDVDGVVEAKTIQK